MNTAGDWIEIRDWVDPGDRITIGREANGPGAEGIYLVLDAAEGDTHVQVALDPDGVDALRAFLNSLDDVPAPPITPSILGEEELREDRHAGSSDLTTEYTVEASTPEAARWAAEQASDGELTGSRITAVEGDVYTVCVQTLRYW